jgi:hypothetical protein
VCRKEEDHDKSGGVSRQCSRPVETSHGSESQNCRCSNAGAERPLRGRTRGGHPNDHTTCSRSNYKVRTASALAHRAWTTGACPSVSVFRPCGPLCVSRRRRSASDENSVALSDVLSSQAIGYRVCSGVRSRHECGRPELPGVRTRVVPLASSTPRPCERGLSEGSLLASAPDVVPSVNRAGTPLRVRPCGPPSPQDEASTLARGARVRLTGRPRRSVPPQDRTGGGEAGPNRPT